MSKTTTPKTPETAEPESPSGLAARLFADREATIRTLSTATSILLLGTVVATLFIGVGPLRARASEIRRIGRPVQVAFAWPPLAGQGPHRPPSSALGTTDQQTWVNAEIRRDVESVAMGLLSDDPLDRASLTKTREALLSTGWFESDLQLIRGADNVVRVTGAWRVPVAAVRLAEAGTPTGIDQLVSSKGELLPPRYPADRSAMKVVIGVQGSAPAVGQAFATADVRAGLDLLKYVGELPQQDQIAGVDVSAFSSERTLSILTELGNRIVWGGGVSDFSPGQPPARVKLARLAEVGRKHGRIDAGRAVIDVRMTDGVYVRDTEGLLSADEAARLQAQAEPAKNHR